MTKLETVRALNDSGPQLQIVESVRTLQQAVSLMHEDLKRLPGAVSALDLAGRQPPPQYHAGVMYLGALLQVQSVFKKNP